MAPWRASTTKSEWLPDDPTAFVPTRLWKLPCITTWDDSRNQNHPTDSAEEADFKDIAVEAGLTAPTVSGSEATKKYIIEATGTGVAIFDYDGDGLMDVFIVNATTLDGGDHST